jgi:hypothetical protein|tara:strand:+ start:450 stop:620 length:171 start_codon:yes stop_codon:yes gene_type:complete
MKKLFILALVFASCKQAPVNITVHCPETKDTTKLFDLETVGTTTDPTEEELNQLNN